MGGWDLELILLCILLAFLYSLTPIFQKMALKKIDQKTVIIITGVFFGIFATIYGYYHRDVLMNDINNNFDNELGFIVFMILLSSSLPIYLFYYLLSKHLPAKIAALTSITPMFVLIISYYVFKEKINFYNVIGIFLIIVGVGLLALKDK